MSHPIANARLDQSPGFDRASLVRPEVDAFGIGLVMGTPVMTVEGELPVEFLCPGDLIITRSGIRTLLSVKATSLQNLSVIRIAGGVLDTHAPQNDICVLPDYRIFLHSAAAQPHITGAATMQTACDLVDDHNVCRTVLAQTRVFHLSFDRESGLYSNGLEIHRPISAAPH